MRIVLDLTKFQASSNNSVSRAPRTPVQKIGSRKSEFGVFARTKHLRTPTPAPAKYPKQL